MRARLVSDKEMNRTATKLFCFTSNFVKLKLIREAPDDALCVFLGFQAPASWGSEIGRV